jgi:hypothetical protein
MAELKRRPRAANERASKQGMPCFEQGQMYVLRATPLLDLLHRHVLVALLFSPVAFIVLLDYTTQYTSSVAVCEATAALAPTLGL